MPRQHPDRHTEGDGLPCMPMIRPATSSRISGHRRRALSLDLPQPIDRLRITQETHPGRGLGVQETIARVPQPHDPVLSRRHQHVALGRETSVRDLSSSNQQAARSQRHERGTSPTRTQPLLPGRHGCFDTHTHTHATRPGAGTWHALRDAFIFYET